MYIVYVLKSLRNEKRYIGYTSKDIEIRITEHNSGNSDWTRSNGPFKLTYSESFDTKTEAIKREHFLKSGQGRKWLDEILKK